jgi:hypothetical protein
MRIGNGLKSFCRNPKRRPMAVKNTLRTGLVSKDYCGSCEAGQGTRICQNIFPPSVSLIEIQFCGQIAAQRAQPVQNLSANVDSTKVPLSGLLSMMIQENPIATS